MVRGPERSFDRDEVLERAMELFWAQGYEATGLSDLLEHMRIGRQSLYNTFGDKKSLFLAALQRYFERQAHRAREVLGQPGSPLDRLQEFFEGSARMSDEAGRCGCFIGNTTAELGARDPQVQAVLVEQFERMAGVLAEALERARQARELAPDADPQALARLLLAHLQGLALLSKVLPPEQIDESLIGVTIQMLRRGAS